MMVRMIPTCSEDEMRLRNAVDSEVKSMSESLVTRMDAIKTTDQCRIDLRHDRFL